jgi:hypothetical protein
MDGSALLLVVLGVSIASENESVSAAQVHQINDASVFQYCTRIQIKKFVLDSLFFLK